MAKQSGSIKNRIIAEIKSLRKRMDAVEKAQKGKSKPPAEDPDPFKDENEETDNEENEGEENGNGNDDWLN